MYQRTSILLACVSSTLLFCSGLMAQTLDLSDTGEKLDGVAAVVNDGIVLTSELDLQTDMVIARLRSENTPLPAMNILRQQILENLVIKEIQMQRATRSGITIPDEMLNSAIADVARRNDTSLNELPALLAGDGISYPMFRNQLREEMVIQRLQQRDVVSRIGVNPRELEEYLAREESSEYRNKRFKVSHILISVPAAATPDELDVASGRAQGIYDELTNGADFAQLAVAYSDAQTALEGGTMGWRNGDALPTLFAEVVPLMQPGEVSAPLRTSSGIHIIKLDDVEGREAVIENQTLARHILITTNEIVDDDIAKQKLIDIREEIVNDGDFEAIAKAVSEDPGSAVEGGDLGWTGPGLFVPVFEETMDGLEIGEISQPFQSPFGWHILQVMERRVHDTTDDVRRQEAMMAIRQSKLAEETELWIRQIRDESFVEYRI
jgi:peptidyl-prolyl cis-trans isomerase SurA